MILRSEASTDENLLDTDNSVVNGGRPSSASNVPRCPMSDETLLQSYESESPDELCLVKTACTLGCKLLQRGPNFVQIWLPELGLVTLEVLHILPFDSIRKRMSVIIRHPITSEAILYTKGADSAIMPCLCDGAIAVETSNSAHLVQSANNHLDNFSREGLRTLVLAKKVLVEEEYQAWATQYQRAETCFENSEKEVALLTDQMESKLHLLGATGIEDKLQEEVPETIQALREAGMNVWILTGDKQETAVNIAYSAKLITEDQCLLKLNAKDSVSDGIERFLCHIAN
ncbi:hypothetical protein Ciccas_002202 [Cichlidogyrus casuarinus]|uniref:Phospholipid-transporting ATPase n=1 Tax=Cichlidogyrus casuarinus TaxID=1844966 RepID=A0ABD2QHX8_9PLAT